MSHAANIVGAHILISQGLSQALLTGQSLGCTAIQIFTHSPRQWNFKLPTQEMAEFFYETQKNSTIQTVVAHASYLINPASPDASTRSRARALLAKEIECCDILSIPYLVVHPGARLTSSIEQAVEHCAQTIDGAFEDVGPVRVKVLIENMAGQGSSIGSTLEELASIYAHIQHKQSVGFCLDTCHAFAAGYKFSNKTDYEHFWEQFDRTLGIDKLHAIHVNDSAKEYASRVDRHTYIGQGHIGQEAFRLIMNDTRLDSIPKILETPKDESYAQDKKALELLRSFIGTL